MDQCQNLCIALAECWKWLYVLIATLKTKNLPVFMKSMASHEKYCHQLLN